jgi:MYXO-CTERM domain-containing protein
MLLSVLLWLLPSDARANELSAVGRDLPTLPPKSLRAPEPPRDWLVETHGWLRIVYHPSLYESVKSLVRDADSLRDRLTMILGQRVLDTVEVRVAASPEGMASLAPAEAPPPIPASGVAYSPLHLVLLSQKSPDTFEATSIDEAFRHQLAHLALFDATAGRSLPRWLQEGFAVGLSGENHLKRIYTLCISQVRGKTLSLSQLEAFADEPSLVQLAYAESADFARFLTGDRDRERFALMIARLRAGDPLERAVSESYPLDLRALEHQWRADLSRRYLATPLLVGTSAGWALVAVGLVVAWRRRKRRNQDLLRRFREEVALDLRAEAIAAAAVRAEVEHGEHARLLVVEQGAGHVVYIVEQKAVPKVEHDGEVHTLH